MKLKIFFFFLFTHVTMVLYSQNFDLETYNKEKKEILNLVINTPQFDSIYNSEILYVLENELLSKTTPIILKRKKSNAIILNKTEMEKAKNDYVGIGDFTMVNNKTRVQLFFSSTTKYLNFSLEKKEGIWIILDSAIMED